MNNNVPIARWLSMFWLCSAVSLVLGQFSGSVTLNGTNGAALTVTGILGIFCTLVQFYPFYRFSRVSERLQRAFTATVLSVAATVVGLLAMTLVPSDTPPYTPSTFYLLFSLNFIHTYLPNTIIRGISVSGLTAEELSLIHI